jgi:hypothetical protein
MKKISFILLVLFAGFCISSCDKYKEVPFYNESDVPVIKGIADAAGNESIDSVIIGQLIKVGGSNFNAVEKVKVNDVEVPLGKITRLRDGLYFTMPRVPRSAVNNLILESKSGEIIYPLKVKYPPFGISGILNEYTPRGTELTILGESMDLYATTGISKVIFSNSETGISAESKISFVSENYIKAIVPENAPDKATVTFFSEETGNRICPVKYRDSEFLIDNLETGYPATRYPEWVVPNASYPLPLNPLPTEGEKYSHINKITTLTGTTLNFVGNYNVIIPNTYYDNAEQYDLKFEILTIEPIKYRIAVSVNWGTTWVPLGPSTQTTDSTLWFSTNKQWQTYSIPMATWKNKTGEKKMRVWNSLPANVFYDVCFDNFRIQQKAK